MIVREFLKHAMLVPCTQFCTTFVCEGHGTSNCKSKITCFKLADAHSDIRLMHHVITALYL